jgi:FdhE protein
MSDVQAIETRHPEFAPWLGVVRVVLEELAHPAWDIDAPGECGAQPQSPWFAQASALPDARAIVRLYQRLRNAAVQSRLPKLAHWHDAGPDAALATACFRAALQADEAALQGFAAGAGVDPEAFAAVMALLPMPYLHACRRRLGADVAGGWNAGYCPCCGAWPALIEVCGIERSRYLRCGRCAAAWQTECLRCPYCANLQHDALGSLLVEDTQRRIALEVCSRCQGYIKVFNTLRPTAPAEVMLADLASVDLDVLAASRTYRRPRGLGYARAEAPS